jgi:hypothetical protein
MDLVRLVDTLFDPQSILDTPIGHYLLIAATLISLVGWLLSGKNTELRKMMAVGVGEGVATLAILLLPHLFPAGPIPPGAMP